MIETGMHTHVPVQATLINAKQYSNAMNVIMGSNLC